MYSTVYYIYRATEYLSDSTQIYHLTWGFRQGKTEETIL